MAKATAALVLTFYFLLGSILLPLGDFSLMRDLPGMYRSYCKIKAGSPDVLDFVGDYLLGGKTVLGNNNADAKADGSLQYQHQANFSLYFTSQIYHFQLLSPNAVIKHPLRDLSFCTSDFQNEILRPPLPVSFTSSI